MVPGTPLGNLDRFKKHSKAQSPDLKKFRTVGNYWNNFKGKHPPATPAISAVLNTVIFFFPLSSFYFSVAAYIWL